MWGSAIEEFQEHCLEWLRMRFASFSGENGVCSSFCVARDAAMLMAGIGKFQLNDLCHGSC